MLKLVETNLPIEKLKSKFKMVSGYNSNENFKSSPSFIGYVIHSQQQLYK
jgi:hypothetical protein